MSPLEQARALLLAVAAQHERYGTITSALAVDVRRYLEGTAGLPPEQPLTAEREGQRGPQAAEGAPEGGRAEQAPASSSGGGSRG